MIDDIGDLSYHIHFEPGKMERVHQIGSEKYTEFLKVLRDAGASKVVHCSVINKYDMDTVYITEKEDLAKLGKEIQLDIDFWENLEILDYGESSIRFCQG